MRVLDRLTQLNCYSVPRHTLTGVPHERSATASDHSHASACPYCASGPITRPLPIGVTASQNPNPSEFRHRSSRHRYL